MEDIYLMNAHGPQNACIQQRTSLQEDVAQAKGLSCLQKCLSCGEGQGLAGLQTSATAACACAHVAPPHAALTQGHCAVVQVPDAQQASFVNP